MKEIHEIEEKLKTYCIIRRPEDIIESRENLVGLDGALSQLRGLAEAVKKTEIFARGDLPFKANLLLYGPPGVGKTVVTRIAAKEAGIALIEVQIATMIESRLGETNKNFLRLFRLLKQYVQFAPAMLFFDEIDAIARERDDPTEVGEMKRLVTQILTEIDHISYQNLPVLVVGATNHPEILDSAVWRRFTFNIEIGYPDDYLRESMILNLIDRTKKAGFEVHISPQYLIKITEGATGADLERMFTIFIINALTQGLSVIDNSFIDRYSDMILKTKSHEDNYKKKFKASFVTQPFNLKNIKTLD
ncbi:MAG: AAA family ATPase [Candidatus Hodarchaeales archaeon]|jgi:AAA+ superfamily predicted ATPase